MLGGYAETGGCAVGYLPGIALSKAGICVDFRPLVCCALYIYRPLRLAGHSF